MAFKGDLTNISLFDVFQTLNTNNQTGVLVLQRDGATKKVFISPEGVRVFFSRSFRPVRLGEIFVRRGVITTQDVEILLLQQKQAYRPFGELLIESGKVTREEVEAILRYQAEDEIYDVFAWDSGSFSFYDGQSASEHTNSPISEVLLDASGLCLEAARRLDEMERLRQRIPANHEYFAQVEGLEPDRSQNSGVICSVYDLLTTPNSVDDLRDLVGLSLFDILRMLVSLLDGGLIRSLRREELIELAAEAKDQTRYERAAQLLEKAHQEDPGDGELLRECVRVVQRLSDPPRLAHHLSKLARICLDEGLTDEAIEHLEQALRHQPDHYASLQILAEALALQGDLHGAAEVNLRMARTHSEAGEVEEAILACRKGLDAAADGVALRYYLAQLLVRADRPAEARVELLALVRDSEATKRIVRNKRAYDLVSGCYRLLLKIDPEDKEAHEGLRSLDRALISARRRRMLLVRGSVAAGILAIAGSVGLAFRTANPQELFAQVLRAQQKSDETALREAVDKLLSQHPESSEAARAHEIRKDIDQRRQSIEQDKKKREEALRSDLAAQWESARSALTDGTPIDAIAQVESFLERLKRPDAGFLRMSMQPHVEYGLLTFLERMVNRFDGDRQEVAASEQKLKANIDRGPSTLIELENRLAIVRSRDWPALVPPLLERLDAIALSPSVGKAGESIADFHKRFETSSTAFDNLDTLFYTVRRERLRAEISESSRVAREKGYDYETLCEFGRARALYEAAYKKADSVVDEEPRVHFLELLKWIETRGIRDDMLHRRDRIDAVVKHLKNFERERDEGRAEVAFRIMRDLRHNHRVVQFERLYKLPYRIESTPMGADVFVDGTLMGKTPVNVEFAMTQDPVFVSIQRGGFENSETRLVPIDPALTGILTVALPKRTIWSKEIAGGTESRPLIHGSLVLVASASTSLLAFHLESGDLVWEATTRDLDRIKASPLVCGEHAYFITGAGRLYQVKLSDGERTDRKELPGQVLFDAASDGELIYVATREKHLICLRGTEILWQKPLVTSPSTRVLLSHGSLFIGTAEGTILVHDAKTGEALGSMTSPSASSYFGGIQACGPLVLAGAEDGGLYAFDATKRSFAWRFHTPGPVTTEAVPGNERIYIATRAGIVSVIDYKGEELDEAFELPGIAPDAPIAKNGFLYAVGGNRVSAYDTRGLESWWDFAFEKGEAPTRIVAGSRHLAIVTSAPRLILFDLDIR